MSTATPAVTAPRVFHKTKAEWAEARAKECRDQANALRYTSSNGFGWKARRKFEGVDNLEREALRFDRMARAFREEGL